MYLTCASTDKVSSSGLDMEPPATPGPLTSDMLADNECCGFDGENIDGREINNQCGCREAVVVGKDPAAKVRRGNCQTYGQLLPNGPVKQERLVGGKCDSSFASPWKHVSSLSVLPSSQNIFRTSHLTVLVFKRKAASKDSDDIHPAVFLAVESTVPTNPSIDQRPNDPQPRRSKQKEKDIQQQGFADGHPLNY